MPVKVKTANSLAKDLTDVSVAVLKMTGAGMHDDPFMAIASKIEKVSSLAEVENIARASVDAAGLSFFALGGAVVRVLELFPTAKLEFPEYKSSREYIEQRLGLEYNKATRAAQAYRKILELNVPYSAFEGIGWSKILNLLDVVTKDTVAEWVDKAKAMNTLSLEEAIKAAKAPKALTGEVVEPKTVTTKTFKLHPDQKQLVNDALKKASDETGSAVDTVNFEAICQSYMGAGIMFSNLDQALAYTRKGFDDPKLFISTVITKLEELCPQLVINAEVKFKGPAAAA